jgi:hypothetical protein
MSNFEQLLSRLDKVKGRNGSYTACCPAHSDGSPSLAVRLADDGRVLLHCFAGCDIDEVLGAIGMEMSDLFPETDRYDHSKPSKPVKPAFYATDLLRIIAFEAVVVSIADYDMSRGKQLGEKDMERMKVAFERIQEATQYAGV